MSSLRKPTKKRERTPVSPDYIAYHQNKKVNNRSSTDTIENQSEHEFDVLPEVEPETLYPTKINNLFVRMADLNNFGAILRASLKEEETADIFRQILMPILDKQTTDIVTKQTKILETKIKSLESDNKRLESKVTSLEMQVDKMDNTRGKTISSL